MMEETYLVEHIKEAVCFVSAELDADLAAARAGSHKLEYVLPDGVSEQLGHVRQPQPKEKGKQGAASREQVINLVGPSTRCLSAGVSMYQCMQVLNWEASDWLAEDSKNQRGLPCPWQLQQQHASQACGACCSSDTSAPQLGLSSLKCATSVVQVLLLNNERFMVPEVLFQPSDIGLQQAGLAQTIVDAVEAAHPDLHPLLYSNVLCTGGSARCPGFAERLYKDLRPLVPDDIEVPETPLLSLLYFCRCWTA